MSPAAAAELWGEAYHRFEKADLDLLKDFAGVISKNNPTGKSIRLGSQNSQQQLIAFIGEKMKLSEQQSNKFPGFQKVAKMLATPKDLMMTASAASPPVNAAMAGIFLAFSMAEMYSSQKTARSMTAQRIAKVFIRRKAACGRVTPQSPNEAEDLRDLRRSLHTTYVDLYYAILKATAMLVCALNDNSWEKRFITKIQMVFGWTEWESIHAELDALEDDIKDDEDEIKDYGNTGPVPSPMAAPRICATVVRKGRNELHTAAVTNNLPKVQELLISGKLDINARTRRQWTALGLAAEKDYFDVVKLLLLAPGIDLNTQNDKGDTPLHVVATNQKLPEDRRVEIINLLVLHGAKVDIRNNGKRTAFLDTAKSGNLKVVKALKQRGADVNQVTGINGWSALHEAAGQGHFEVVKWLVGKKANTTIKTKAGNWRDNTAAQVARKRHLDEIAKFIEAATEAQAGGKK